MVDWDLIKKLIQVLREENITGLAVEEGGVKYEVCREKGAAVASNIVSAVETPTTEVTEEEEGVVAITSPMVGTFYRAPSPDAPPFVEVEDEVEVGKIVCIIEAMKLFNEIESEVKGKVTKILVENSQPVEYGQKLMLIKKA